MRTLFSVIRARCRLPFFLCKFDFSLCRFPCSFSGFLPLFAGILSLFACFSPLFAGFSPLFSSFLSLCASFLSVSVCLFYRCRFPFLLQDSFLSVHVSFLVQVFFSLIAGFLLAVGFFSHCRFDFSLHLYFRTIAGCFYLHFFCCIIRMHVGREMLSYRYYSCCLTSCIRRTSQMLS